MARKIAPDMKLAPFVEISPRPGTDAGSESYFVCRGYTYMRTKRIVHATSGRKKMNINAVYYELCVSSTTLKYAHYLRIQLPTVVCGGRICGDRVRIYIELRPELYAYGAVCVLTKLNLRAFRSSNLKCRSTHDTLEIALITCSTICFS